MASLKRSLSALVVAVAIGLGSVASATPALGSDDRSSGKHASKDDEKDARGGPPARGHGAKAKDHDDRGQRSRDGSEGPGDGRERSDGSASEGEGATNDDEAAGRGNAQGRGAAPRGGASATPSPTPTSQPTPGPGGQKDASLALTSRASRILAEVGDDIVYTVTVSNTSDDELADIAVVDLVPAEVDVASVPLSDDVDAAQTGRSPRGEDVVWILKTLPAGATVELSWTGVVVTSGDLEATNVVQATVEGTREARASTTTFLGTATGVAAQKTAPEVMPRRVVTFVRVPATDPKVQGVLPATGLGVDWFVWLALAVGLVGMVLLVVGRPPATVLTGAGVALAIVALLSFVTLPSDTSRTPTVSPTTQGDDQVKGKQIFRDDDARKADQRGKPDAGRDRPTGKDGADRDEPADEPVATEGTEQTVLVRTVRTVKVPVDAAPIGDGAAANDLSFSWDETSRRIVQATSSRLFTDAPYELLVSLGDGDEVIEATLTLRNVSDDLIAVDGVLFHEIRGEGAALTLETEPIDLVLRPGGQIRATFVYLLPTGDYGAGANFVAG